MQRACERCGRPFVAQRSSARWCGSSCRSEASQARKAGRPESTVTAAAPVDPDVRGPVAAAVETSLARLNIAESVDVAVLRVLAARIDADVDTGSGLAALVRMLRVVWDRVESSVARPDDPLEQMRRRVARRRSMEVPS